MTREEALLIVYPECINVAAMLLIEAQKHDGYLITTHEIVEDSIDLATECANALVYEINPSNGAKQ